MPDLKIIAAYSRFLAAIHARHLIGGSIASSAWGEQRQTNDADFLIELSRPTYEVCAENKRMSSTSRLFSGHRDLAYAWPTGCLS
jgi:hypothetical protein